MKRGLNGLRAPLCPVALGMGKKSKDTEQAKKGGRGRVRKKRASLPARRVLDRAALGPRRGPAAPSSSLGLALVSWDGSQQKGQPLTIGGGHPQLRPRIEPGYRGAGARIT